MEVGIPGEETPCPDINGFCGSLTDPCNSTHSNLKDHSVDGLKTHLNEFLSKEDTEIAANHNPSPGKNNKADIVGEDDREAFGNIKSDNSVSEKWLSKCVAFPSLGKPEASNDELPNEDKFGEDDKASNVKWCAKPVDHGRLQSMSQPTPRKLVSAIKGSRERQGIPPKNLSVTWAPDVYDPTPTSVSHFPSNKNQRYGKKHGKKNRQKNGGKSSRGSKGKDKKHAQKNNTSPVKSKPLQDDALVRIDEPQPEVSGFNIVNPDPFCGSSFMKKSIASMHFPVTEAK